VISDGDQRVAPIAASLTPRRTEEGDRPHERRHQRAKSRT
jgi:hypothetical protein